MTTPKLNLPTLLAIAQAAADVPPQHVGALAHYEDTFSPSTVLALLQRVRHLETERGCLAAALVEACDIAEGKSDGGVPRSTIETLRALVKS